MPNLCSLDLGKSCCCNTLPNCFEMVVCCVELNACILWELCFKYLLRGVKHDCATFTLADATKDHQVLNLIELTILSQSIAQVHTHCFVDERTLCFFCWLGHIFLNKFETLCMIFMLDGAHGFVRVHVFGRSFYSTTCCKFCCSPLTQIHM